MPPASSLLVTLVSLVAGLACLLVSVILVIAAARERKLARLQNELCLEIVCQRLRSLESQIAELKSNDRSVSENAGKPAGPPSLLESQPVRAARASTDLNKGPEVAAEPTLIAVPDLSVESGSSEPRSVDELGERHGEAWTLAAAGMPPAEIARQTGQPIGQVEVVVGLYRKLRSSRGSIDHVQA